MPIDYTYPAGGGYQSTTTTPAVSVGGIPDMSSLLQYAIKQRQSREAWQRMMDERKQNLSELEGISGISDAATRRAAVTNPDRPVVPQQTTPTFVKNVATAAGTGAIPAQAWEPGAVQSGELAHGYQPFSPNAASSVSQLPSAPTEDLASFARRSGAYTPSTDNGSSDLALAAARQQEANYQRSIEDQRDREERRRLGLLGIAVAKG